MAAVDYYQGNVGELACVSQKLTLLQETCVSHVVVLEQSKGVDIHVPQHPVESLVRDLQEGDLPLVFRPDPCAPVADRRIVRLQFCQELRGIVLFVRFTDAGQQGIVSLGKCPGRSAVIVVVSSSFVAVNTPRITIPLTFCG